MAVRRILTLVLLVGLLPFAHQVQATGALSLAAGPGAAAETGGFGALERLFGASDSQPEPLPPEQAFIAKLRVKDASTVVATFSPAKDYYLYRDRIIFDIAQPAAAQIAAVRLPDGDMNGRLTSTVCSTGG